MFSLHETTQRTVCRVLFVACCALPAAAAVLWCGYESTPWAAARWEAAIAKPLGGVVETAGFQRVRPGVLQVARLGWLPDGAKLDALELTAAQVTGRGLTAREAAIDAASIKQSLVLLGQTALPDRPTRARIKSLQIRSESTVETLHNLEIDAEAGGGVWSVVAVGQTDAGLVRITAAPVGDGVRLTCDCRQGPLPAWVLGSLVERLAGLSDARFRGQLSVEHSGDVTSGEVAGTFTDFPLAALLGDDSPHQWEGRGTLAVERFAWSDNRLLEAAGTVEAGAGAISGTLLAAAESRLGCGLRLRPTRETSAFDRAAFVFRIDANGIVLSGRCPAQPGALLTRSGATLLTQPSHERLPIAQLVQTLAAEGGGWVPATRQAQELARGLPLPQPAIPHKEAPSVRTATRPGQPRLREPATIR